MSRMHGRWSRKDRGGLIAMGVTAMLGALAVGLQVGAAGAALTTLAAWLVVPALVWAILRVDLYEPEPRRLLWLTFGWGATGAVVLGVIASSLTGDAVVMLFGEAAGGWSGTVIGAPVGEELAKGLAVLVVARRLGDEFNGVVDGIVYGAMVGLGFMFAENILYFAGALSEGMDHFTALWVLRGILLSFNHSLFTAMTGIGFAMAYRGGRGSAKWAALGLLAAMALHATWNAATLMNGAAPLVYVFVFIPLVAALSVFAVLASKRESQVLRRHLEQDVSTGLFTAHEIEELASLAYRKTVLQHFRRRGGRQALEARLDFQDAAASLAFLRHRSHPGRPAEGEERRLVQEVAYRKRAMDPSFVVPAALVVGTPSDQSPTS